MLTTSLCLKPKLNITHDPKRNMVEAVKTSTDIELVCDARERGRDVFMLTKINVCKGH